MSLKHGELMLEPKEEGGCIPRERDSKGLRDVSEGRVTQQPYVQKDFCCVFLCLCPAMDSGVDAAP